MRWMAAIALAALLAGPMADLTSKLLTDNPVASVAFAEEGAEAPASGGGSSYNWWDALKASGACGVVIILLSIAFLALAIQYAVEQKREKLMPPHVLAELEQLFEEQAYDEAAEMCQAEDCYLTRIVGAGLAQMEGGYDSIMKGVELTGDEETTKYFMKLSNLALIAGVSPMLGLFGTVQGMIEAFAVIASTSGGANPAQLADSISKALMTTFEGLLVAIPCTCAFHFLRNRLINITLETASFVASLFQRFRNQAA